MKPKPSRIVFVRVAAAVAAVIVALFLSPAGNAPAAAASPPDEVRFETVASNLVIPWEIAFLPNGDMIFTERPGTLVRMGTERREIKVPGIEAYGEGGLLGMTLHPDFEKNGWIYLYETTSGSSRLENRVVRYVYDLSANALTQPRVIISGIPAARYHDGGRIAFGPDGKLYVTTGDATSSDTAQDIHSLSGKILRLNADGTIPADNPFGSAVYCYGNRNSQGLAWDNRGRLWATEHGRSGTLSGLDELNLIEKGTNYGWPVIEGDQKHEGMVTPVVNSGPSYTWAPAAAVYYDGAVFFTGLRGEALYRYDLSTGRLTEHFKGRFGRLRAAVIHGGWLYLSTSDRDGRGTVGPGDDRIVRIPLDEIGRLR